MFNPQTLIAELILRSQFKEDISGLFDISAKSLLQKRKYAKENMFLLAQKQTPRRSRLRFEVSVHCHDEELFKRPVKTLIEKKEVAVANQEINCKFTQKIFVHSHFKA